MKKIGYLLFAATIMTSVGCSDDTIVEKPVVPAEVGEEITFGSSLEKAGKRTVYDDTPTTGEDGQTQYYRVSWVDGDEVAIYCPQASQGTLVNYSITPAKDDPTASELVTKVNPDQAGLQWGQQDDHYFYAFYPASRVTGTEDGKISGTVPTTQNVKEWNPVTENGGTTWYGKTQTEENAYMWAYGHFKRSEMGEATIPLTFHPWMTVLEIVIQGPESGSKTVTNVNIRASEGTQTMLAGDFICDMTPVEENGASGIPNYVPVGNQGTVNNTISISGYNPATDDFITLGPNDKMVVRAYLLPIDEQNSVNARNIQISVATLNGAALTRTLGFSNHGQNSIQPHKVNRVTLPRLTDTGTNYWLSSLDKDIYLSELSLPGSKFSYLTEANSAFPVYQGATISQQFLDGVRAFIVQVGARATYQATETETGNTGFPWYRPIYEYSYEYSDATLPIDGGNGQTLANTINDIAAGLATAEEQLGSRNLECAVVMVTYSGGGNVQVNFTGDPESGANVNTVGGADNVWMDAIQHELKDLSGEAANRIYKETIDANTTLDDVKGKIIFKVNYNTDAQASHMPADAGVPALFSMWDETMNTVPLRYGSANPNATANLSWMYHEATHVGSNTEITQDNKEEEVVSVLQKSVDAYLNNDAHNIWYMVDAGGTFYEGAESNEGVINLTKWLNPIVRRTLQTRGQNAATGLVFFNFADKQENSGVRYETNELIQTIIDNNFKFNLRKKGSSETPEPTPSTQADAAFAKGENVWQ